MSIPIIFQDQDLLVVNKPPGLVVNNAATVQEDQTVQSLLAAKLEVEQQAECNQTDWQKLVPADFDDQYGTPLEIFNRRQGMVHRLDKDTSGALLWGKNPGSLVNLLQQFKQRQVQKKYLALVHGQFKVETAVINAPINRSQQDRQKFKVAINGRPAVTYYRVLQVFKPEQLQLPVKVRQEPSYQQGFSLVECFPKTGRTHQLRVHLAHLNHPLVADADYGGKKRSNLDQAWCPRQFLHASWIKLTHPRSGEMVEFTVPLADDLAGIIGKNE